MRMTTRGNRSERGAVLVIAAVFMAVAAIFMAFVVDIGDQRQNRRQLTSVTDSVALSVAHEWAVDGLDPDTSDRCDGDDLDKALAVSNNPVGNTNPAYGCSFTDVTPFRSGVVTATSTENVDYSFGGVTGVDRSSTASLTSVRVQPIVGGGVRPVAICSGQFSTAGWTSVAGGSVLLAPAGSTGTLVLSNTTGSSGDPCESPGTWNQVLFRSDNSCPGQKNAADGSNEFREQFENGSPYPVAVNDCVSAAPGRGGLQTADLQVIEGTVIALPVFDDAPGGGAGIYLVKSFLEVFVESAANTGPNTTTFTFRPLRLLTRGTCCLLNEFNKDVSICDTGTPQGARNVGADVNCKPINLANQRPPPPIPPCGVSVTPASQSVDRTGGKTNSAVVFTATLTNMSECTGLSYLLKRRPGGQEVIFSSADRIGNSVTLSLDANTSAQQGEWDVVIRRGAVNISPAQGAVLTVNT